MSNPTKKQKFEETADPEVDETVLKKLEEVQEKIEKISEEAAGEVLKIEKAFAVKKVPLLKERTDVIKQIPKFWLKAFLNHAVLSAFFTDEDQTVFEHLEELTIDDKVDEGYTINYKFKSNPFFSNDKLKVEVKFSEENESIEPTEIKWKPGKNLVENNSEEGSFFAYWTEPQVLNAIKDEVWPNAVDYYHGAVVQEGPEDEEEEDEEEK